MPVTAVTILIYFGAFALLGYRRGLRREAVVLGVSGGALGGFMWMQAQPLTLPASLGAWRDLAAFRPELWPFAAGASPASALQPVNDSLVLTALWSLLFLWSQSLGPKGEKPEQMTRRGRLIGAAMSMSTGWLCWQVLAPWLPSGEFTGSPWAWLGLNEPAFTGPDRLATLNAQLPDLLVLVRDNGPTLMTVGAIGVVLYFVSRRVRPGARAVKRASVARKIR